MIQFLDFFFVTEGNVLYSFMPGDIPREQTQAFLDAFGRMPQRVLARMVLSGMSI